MFGLFKKTASKKPSVVDIFAPMNGQCVFVADVNDMVFSQKMVGDGMAVIPSDNKIYAPTDGVLTQVFKTLHAYAIRTPGGNEVLIHCGIETVSLNGKGFLSYKSSGDTVCTGDLLGEMDLSFITGQGKDIITPVIITNIHESYHIRASAGTIHAGDLLFSLHYD